MKKFCKNCGLLLTTETEQYGQFKCNECGYINKSTALEKVNDKIAMFDTCTQCGFTSKGRLVRKKGEIREYHYKCSNSKCLHEWNQTWKKTALKDRVKKKIGNLR